MPDAPPAWPTAELCSSPVHRAAAGLLAAALRDEPPAGLAADLAASEAEHLATIVEVNHIHPAVFSAIERHPALADSLPPELAREFKEMFLGNIVRNEKFSVALARVGQAFADAGIRAVALKGGAELLAPFYPETAHRYISDIDILVEESALGTAVEILQGMGGRLQDGGLDEANHHAAPVVLAGTDVGIELHRRIGGDVESDLLPASEVLESAAPHASGLYVPAGWMRLVHMVAHGQISHLRHDFSAVYLRDVLDHVWMRRGLDDAEYAAARNRFVEHGAANILDAFEALSFAIVPDGPNDAPASAARWARRALDRFGKPERRGRAELFHWARIHLRRFFASRMHRRRYLSIIARKGLIRTMAENLGVRRKNIR